MEDLSSSMSMKYDTSILSISPNESALQGRPLNPTPQKAKISNTPLDRVVGISIIDSKLDPIDESKSDLFGGDSDKSVPRIRGTL